MHRLDYNQNWFLQDEFSPWCYAFVNFNLWHNQSINSGINTVWHQMKTKKYIRNVLCQFSHRKRLFIILKYIKQTELTAVNDLTTYIIQFSKICLNRKCTNMKEWNPWNHAVFFFFVFFFWAYKCWKRTFSGRSSLHLICSNPVFNFCSDPDFNIGVKTTLYFMVFEVSPN